MNEYHKQLKNQVEDYYKIIEITEEQLKKIREIQCEHPESEIKKNVDYNWRIDSTCKADICGICGEILETEFDKDKIE